MKEEKKGGKNISSTMGFGNLVGKRKNVFEENFYCGQVAAGGEENSGGEKMYVKTWGGGGQLEDPHPGRCTGSEREFQTGRRGG